MTRRRATAGIILALVAVGAFVAGCRKKPPPPPPEAVRPPRESAIEVVRTPLACVQDGSVVLMDGDGNNQRRLSATGKAVPESLSWSPDSHKLAFWTLEAPEGSANGVFRLCLADVEAGREPAVLYIAPSGLGGDAPVFSPDGGELWASVYGGKAEDGKPAAGLLAQDFSQDRGILRVPLGGGEPKQLLDRPGGRSPLRRLRLSPDGKMLAAIGGQSVPRGYLVLVDLSRGEGKEYRDRPALQAEWCPKALRLAYLAPKEHGLRDLRVWVIGRSESTAIAEGLGPLASFAWAPDGRRLAYTDGTTYTVTREFRGKWAQTSRQETKQALYRWPTWSPNGHAVVFEYHGPGSTTPVLKRDAQSPEVAAKDLLTGGTRPLFAGPG